MKQIHVWLILPVLATSALVQAQQPPRVVDLHASDGTLLKASYFAAAKPGPGVLLFHQSNRTRTSWEGLAEQLAAAGINTLTVDSRGHGESGGKLEGQSSVGDLDSAFQYLISQPGVARDVIGVGGAGWLGVGNSTETARRHSAAQEAPWLWYETSNPSKVPANGAHGTDLFKTHTDLPGIIVQWFVTTLLTTPGHAPADPLAAAPILREIEFGHGVAHAAQQLMEARKRDPDVHLWAEVSLDIIGEDYLREAEDDKKARHLQEADAEVKTGIEVLKLNLLAYPYSADANFNVATAYMQDGQRVLARQYAEKALAMLDSHTAPLSSWSDTEQRRGEIRAGIQDLLKQLAETH